MELSPQDVARIWFDWLNRKRETSETFSDDVRVVFFPEGRGGREQAYDGLKDINMWGRRGDDGNFLYEASDDPVACELSDAIPSGDADRGVAVGFKVSATFMEWSNTGRDVLHVNASGRIRSVLHIPDAIPQEAP